MIDLKSKGKCGECLGSYRSSSEHLSLPFTRRDFVCVFNLRRVQARFYLSPLKIWNDYMKPYIKDICRVINLISPCDISGHHLKNPSKQKLYSAYWGEP